MGCRIKNWHTFQHYKDRRPPWIKLYRELLDDVEWYKLSGDACKALVMLWIIASDHDGELPSIPQLSFRLRLTLQKTNATLSELSHWVEQSASDVLADCKQDARPETEKRQRREETDGAFENFWNEYPRKVGKGAARKAWEKVGPDVAAVLKAVQNQKRGIDWQKDNGKWIPHPATWLNQERWLDEVKLTYQPAPVDPKRTAAMEADAKRQADERYRKHQEEFNKLRIQAI